MKKRLVLLVDEDEKILQALADWLNLSGFPVLISDNSFAALNLLYYNEVGILIVDVNMPEINGLELMKRAGRLIPSLSTVLTGSKIKASVIFSALKEGAVDYLEKPFCPERLEIILDKINQQHNILAENLKLKKELKQSSKTKKSKPHPLLSLEDMEKEMVVKALQTAQGNRSQASKILGISRPTFYEKIKKFGLA